METPQNQRGIWELFSKYPVVLPQPYFESIFDIINTPYTVINVHVPPQKRMQQCQKCKYMYYNYIQVQNIAIKCKKVK